MRHSRCAGSWGNVYDEYFTRLSSILISRFMMNLQEAKRCTSGSTGPSWSVSRLRFERVIGSIGETLGSIIMEGTDNDDEAEE